MAPQFQRQTDIVDKKTKSLLRKKEEKETECMKDFFLKYPDSIYAYQQSIYESERYGSVVVNPAVEFIERQKQYMRKGFTKCAAFSKVETEMNERLRKDREDIEILRRSALDNQARSLLSFYEQTSVKI